MGDTGSKTFGKANKKGTHKGCLFCLARPEGFEPPTAWFVARYSIQLSYGRIVLSRAFRRSYNHVVVAEREGFEPSKGY